MPIYEYECGTCGQRFEQFVRPSTPSTDIRVCSACQSQNLVRLSSLFAVNSKATKQLHLKQARKLAQKEQRDKKHAETEEMMHHHNE
jgi:putative FmdB family regulatory protein